MTIAGGTNDGGDFVGFRGLNGVAVITLQRPSHANAYHAALLDQFEQVLDRLIADDSWRAVIVTGSGERSFCAGADLHELSGRTATDALKLRSGAVFDRLAEFPLVTIAAINGVAVGGGLELALACDLRLAASHARFWFPETALGIIPAAGGTQRLSQAVGHTRAKELILGGREWSADEAAHYGLVNSVVPGPKLIGTAEAWAAHIAKRDPLALHMAKTAIGLDAGVCVGRIYEATAQAVLYERRAKTKSGDSAVDPATP